MSSLSITVEVRSVYGRDTVYPVDAAAKSFAAIAGTTTLTVPVLHHIVDMGYTITYKRPPDDVFGPGGVMDRIRARDGVPS